MLSRCKNGPTHKQHVMPAMRFTTKNVSTMHTHTQVQRYHTGDEHIYVLVSGLCIPSRWRCCGRCCCCCFNTSAQVLATTLRNRYGGTQCTNRNASSVNCLRFLEETAYLVMPFCMRGRCCERGCTRTGLPWKKAQTRLTQNTRQSVEYAAKEPSLAKLPGSCIAAPE